MRRLQGQSLALVTWAQLPPRPDRLLNKFYEHNKFIVLLFSTVSTLVMTVLNAHCTKIQVCHGLGIDFPNLVFPLKHPRLSTTRSRLSAIGWRIGRYKKVKITDWAKNNLLEVAVELENEQEEQSV